MIYPGPEVIAAATSPGGVVIRGYAVPTNRVLFQSSVTTIDDVAAVATTDAQVALFSFERGVCLVAYDGDTGERIRQWPSS